MIAPTYGCLKNPPNIPKPKDTEMTKANQTIAPVNETPELFIQPAENGGFTVKSGSPHDPAIKKVLMGAYSCGADLIEDMPELLGLDGITAAAYTEDEPIGLNIFDDEGRDYPDEEQPLFDLGDRAAELNEREDELSKRENKLREYEMDLIDFAVDTSTQERGLNERERQMNEHHNEYLENLSRKEVELDAREADLDKRKGDLDRRTDALSKCERRVYENAAELSRRKADLDKREGNVSRREEAVNMRELGVTDFHFTSKRGLDGAI